MIGNTPTLMAIKVKEIPLKNIRQPLDSMTIVRIHKTPQLMLITTKLTTEIKTIAQI